MISENYKICTRCIMDTSDPEIYFDENGVCNHCHRYDDLYESRTVKPEERVTALSKLVSDIKKAGNGKEYDCIIGVSGGVDSTYVALLTKELGLNPLAVHFDNGWNSELAVKNIEKILDVLKIDLYTYVIDWDLFRDIQIAFLKSSTPDGEIPTDHAINALLFKEAEKRGIRYVINGMNFATESMAVRMWSYGHSDFKYIRNIYRKFGNNLDLKKYPHFSLLGLFKYTFINRIKVVSILNYIGYDREKVMSILKDKLDWKYYGGKHYESVYTRFYQGYFLPVKFNIDKRRGHLSDLIQNKQISREDALSAIAEKPYNDESLLKEDIDFMMKKLGLKEDTFQKILKEPPGTFLNFRNSEKQITFLKNIVNDLRKRRIISK